MKRATRGRNRAVAIHQVFFVERLQAGKLGKIHDKPAINNSNQQARSRVTKPPANGSNTAAVSAGASYCSAAAAMNDRFHKHGVKNGRITLLISLLWGAGLLTTLANGAARDPGSTWVDARHLATVVAIFVMGAAAFDALSERTRRRKVVAMIALVVGVAASLSRGDVFAAFIVFILCGFVLDWWGVVRPDD
jgi:hypothetical protein